MRADSLDLGQKVGQIGAALHGHDQRERLIPDIGVDFLQFVVIVKLEILELQSIDELAVAVPHRGGRDDNGGGGF